MRACAHPTQGFAGQNSKLRPDAVSPVLFWYFRSANGRKTANGSNRWVRNAWGVKMLEVRVSFCDFPAMHICGNTGN